MNAVHLDYRRIARYLDGFATSGGMQVIAAALVALLMAATIMATIFAVSIMTASTPAAGFSVAERASHARLVEFTRLLKRASSDKRAARLQCELLGASGKALCTAKARADERRAKAEARKAYLAGNVPSSDIVQDLVISRSH